jgi:hypothetical protein
MVVAASKPMTPTAVSGGDLDKSTRGSQSGSHAVLGKGKMRREGKTRQRVHRWPFKAGQHWGEAMWGGGGGLMAFTCWQ